MIHGLLEPVNYQSFDQWKVHRRALSHSPSIVRGVEAQMNAELRRAQAALAKRLRRLIRPVARLHPCAARNRAPAGRTGGIRRGHR